MIGEWKTELDILMKYVNLLLSAQSNGQKVTAELDEAIKKLHIAIVNDGNYTEKYGKLEKAVRNYQYSAQCEPSEIQRLQSDLIQAAIDFINDNFIISNNK